VLTEENLDNIGARLEHTPGKSLKRLAQETGVSKTGAGTVTQLLKPSSESWFPVCCARRIVVRVLFNKTVNCEKYLRVEGQRFQHLL
jgi:hypothetical protein